MRKFNVTITITFQKEVEATHENVAEELAWEKLMGNPTRYADVDIEEIEEKE